MRLRQWILSVLLFLVSVVFLLFSKTLFTGHASQNAKSLDLSAANECRAILLPNKDYYPVLKNYFQKAQTSIVGTIYLVKTSNYPDNEPADLLRELSEASKRKVHVEIVLEYSDDGESVASNQSAAQMLRSAGANVRFDSSKVATHAKTFVVDGRYCFIGSHNFTHAAMSRNAELSIFVDSTEMGKKITDFVEQIPK